MDPFQSDWQKFLEAVSAWQILLWVAAIVAVVLLVVKAWPFLRKMFQTVDILTQLPVTLKNIQDDLAAMKPTVAEIRHEVLPNGGNSLRDSQNRTEAAVEVLTKDMSHVKRQQASTKTTLARTSKQLTEHLNKE